MKTQKQTNKQNQGKKVSISQMSPAEAKLLTMVGAFFYSGNSFEITKNGVYVSKDGIYFVWLSLSELEFLLDYSEYIPCIEGLVQQVRFLKNRCR